MSINELPELTHISLTLPSAGFTNLKDFVTMEILKAMMGGGDAFSSGGPGKGMYSRLYRNALAMGIFYNCKAEHYNYKNTSLFSINFSVFDKRYSKIGVQLVAKQLADLKKCIKNKNEISAQELLRSKNQLKMRTFMELEQKPQQFEDLCRQLVFRGSWLSPEVWAETVDGITLEDVSECLERYWGDKENKISYSVVGDTKAWGLPKYSDVTQLL